MWLGVSSLSIVFMAIAAALSILVPLALIVFMGIKKRLKWKAMLFGMLLFFVFVLVLERIMHFVVLGADPTQSVIYNKTILYMLYGGFAAGIFEETARLLCFKGIIKVGESDTIDTGISYGLGHGGIEAILLGGLSAIGNLATSVMYNKGLLSTATAAMNEQQLQDFNKAIDALVNTQSYMFLLSGVERVAALVLQIALSLFVFKAVREKRWQYFGLAILIHAGVDMFAVLFQRGVITNIFLLEGVIILVSVVTAVVAFKINRRNPQKEQTIVL